MYLFGRFFSSRSLWLTLTLILIAGVLHGLPWIIPRAGWVAPLGIGAALVLASRRPSLGLFFGMLVWSILAIVIAFHWSPQAMAYSVSSGIWLGTTVAAPLMLWDALRMALGYFLASYVTRDLRWNWLAAGMFAIALEHWMPSVFPWKLGFMILGWPWLYQAVDIFGASWTTLVVFALAGCVVNVVRILLRMSTIRSVRTAHLQSAPGSKHELALGVMLPAILLSGNFAYSGYAYYYWPSLLEHSPDYRMALIQVDPSFKDSAEKLRTLTEEVADRVDLVCWPESSGGTYDMQLSSLRNDDQVFQMSRMPQRGLRPWPTPACELLLGGKNYVGTDEKPDQLFIAAMLIDRREQIAGRYHKQFLMPFGEYVPAKETLPFLGRLFDMTDVITPGDDVNVLQADSAAKIGAMLCYEDMVPEVARAACSQGANVIVSLINGSAFDSPYTLWQHRMLAQLRALETRRYFLRCAATGETCIISPMGKIQSRLPLQEDGVLLGNVQLIDQKSPYVRFPYLMHGLLVMSLGGFFVSRARRKKSI